MKTKKFTTASFLIMLLTSLNSEAAQTLDICGKLYEVYGAFSEGKYTEIQQQQYCKLNLESKKFQVTSIVEEVRSITNGVQLYLDKDKCVSVNADVIFPNRCELNYILSLKKGDRVTVEGIFDHYSTLLGAKIKLKEATVISSECDKQTNSKGILETTPSDTTNHEHPINKKNKNDCPEKLLSTDDAKGIYLGNSCADYCYSTIKLESGKEISVMCGEDESESYFGKTTGQNVVINYDIVQFWHEYDEQCKITKICKSGKNLERVTEKINLLPALELLIKKKEQEFETGTIDNLINLYSENIVFFGQHLTRVSLRKSFENYFGKWTKRKNNFLKINQIMKTQSGQYEVLYNTRFSYRSINNKCMSGIAHAKLMIVNHGNSFLITEERNTSIDKDETALCP